MCYGCRERLMHYMDKGHTPFVRETAVILRSVLHTSL